jgi:membrane dipeptidase
MTIPVFDLHCDTADRIAWQFLPEELRRVYGRDFYGPGDEEDPEGCRELARGRCQITLEKIGTTPWAQSFACFIPDEISPADAIAFEGCVSAYFGQQLEKNPQVAVARTSGEIRSALEGGGVCAVRTIENARLFANDLGLVEKLAEEGLVMASLSWNAGGPLASGHETHEHMSTAGIAALAEMERCGVALDVSHLNDECFADVAAHATRPFCASHSNARAICGHKRNLTDDQFRAVMASGGVVGLNYCSYFLVDGATGEKGKQVTFDQVAAHIEHWLDLGGEDAVALGGDLDGADVPDLLDGADKLPRFQQLLVVRFGQDITEKLCYKNALAYLERVQAN